MLTGETTTGNSGTCRGAAPEILNWDGRGSLPTLESDIWSFGMTVLEVSD